MKQEFYPMDMEDYVRIGKCLAEARPDLSRSYIQRLLKSGQVLVNGQGIKTSYIMAEGDRAELEVPEAVEPGIDAEPMDLDIPYENQDLILINKSKGTVVHLAAGHYNHTLVNGLVYYRENQLSGINGVMRPGIVYRIDMDTTGVITVRRNSTAYSSIAAQLKEHSTTRRHQAIVHGVIAEDGGTVDAPIGRHPVECKKMSINYQNGKNVVTHYRVLNRFGQYAHAECRLEIGRAHQICVHMTSIRHPLLGDAVYGSARCPISGLYGQTLHVGILGFIHPRTGEYTELSAPLSDYFEKLLRTLG